jgi:cytochrome c-type biogenesis protein CcmH/NrfF
VEASQTDQSTLPVWVVPLVLLVLAGGGVAAYLVRRRGRAHP